ncbi:11379_t:CDS:2 [Diversispora eburnea]|uniref:Box C/D snoRNA protein 1 n=1 Tax=Diversispora eburnea TaxID=1213867 RepID=A0A9N8YK56_9GLOM|nr:11379_t:CDS:2 [Diversispora eburnea]
MSPYTKRKMEENSEISDNISASQQITDNSENVTNPKICQICNNDDWKYKCPRCEFLTCSLTCSKLHKEKYNCNGIRSKTSFIPLNKYGYQELMNGKDLSRVIDATHRARIDQTNSQQKKFSKNLGKKKLYKTRQRGQKRYTKGSNIIK